MAQAVWNRPAKPTLINITDEEFKANAYQFYAYLRDEQPVYKAKLGQMEVWLVTRYDDVLALLKDPRLIKNPYNVAGGAALKSRPWIPPFMRALEKSMLDTDDPDHARLRKLVHKAFTPRRLEELVPRIEAITSELLDAQMGQSSMDLIKAFSLPLPLIVISELLGVPVSDRDKFHRWANQMIQPPTTVNMLRTLPAVMGLMRYLRRQFELRRQDPRDDLMTALVQAEEAGDKLSEDEMLAMGLLLLLAGHETTVNLITTGTLALLQHPDQLQLLREQPELIESAVEEVVRFVNPVETATERYASEDLELHGQTIRRGELVLGVLASANRDERYFAHPDVLDITRQKNRHLGFGFGIHFCLGAPLARLEGQIAIRQLVQRLPNLRLNVDPSELRWRGTPIVRGLKALPVAF